MLPSNPDLEETANVVKQTLLASLSARRSALGLTQAELANRAGVSRMTVQRSESPGADMSLSSFVAMGLATNMTVRLVADTSSDDPDVFKPSWRDLVHRGTSYNRTQHDLGYRDRQREAAFATNWEAANPAEQQGLAPMLQTLVPQHTQDQATAVATVVQWLGSEVGFDFLTKVLAEAKYSIVDNLNESAAKRR